MIIPPKHQFFIVVLLCFAAAQYKVSIEELIRKGEAYYNQGDYGNAIIIYEDILAEQELAYENDDIQIAETMIRLGEMYSLTGIPVRAEYYFQQAIIIIEKSFQSRKKSLEIPLINLLKIYSLNKDTTMMQNIENRLYSLSALFQAIEGNQKVFSLSENMLYSAEEDSARDLMEHGMSYINSGLFSKCGFIRLQLKLPISKVGSGGFCLWDDG